MLKSFLRSYLRNLWRNRTYSFLNIAGLAIGICCSTLIFLWVEDEFSFDHQFEKKKELYQVMENQTYDGNTFTFAATPGPLAPGMKNDMPGIANTSHLTWSQRSLFSFADKLVYERGNNADPAFLSMFGFKFLRGNPATALAQPNDIVITQRMARTFFASDDPLGKTLKMDNDQAYTVTGVIQDLPADMTFDFDWLEPYESYLQKNQWLRQWGTNGIQTFAELKQTANPAAINSLLSNYIQTNSPGAIAKPFLFPMSDWRLYNNFENGRQSGGRIKYVRLFTLIAWIILIIACINFMNLATAGSERRSREVGVRKVLGAGRSRLVSQFIGEALLMALMAVILAVLLTAAILPAFNNLVGKQLSLDLLRPSHLAGLLAIGVFSGLLAGSYPAFYLSSFNPIYVLKGLKIKMAGGAVFIRKSLVVLQFSTSVIFIIATIIIYQQLKYVQQRQMGYDKNNLMFLNLKGKMGDHFDAIRNDLLGTGLISNATLSRDRILLLGSNTGDFDWQGKDPNKQVLITLENVSPQYISTMGMQLKAGRDFHDIPAADSNNVIINETLAHLISKGSAVGSLLTRNGGQEKYRVIGVVGDFVYNDMYTSGAPLILYNNPAQTNFLTIRFKPGADIPHTLAATEKVIKAENPGYPFEYKFVSEEFNRLFYTETLTGRLAGIFAALAIFISCLGLFGLAAYAAERRVKEVGIRKVLGASVPLLTGLLSKDFLMLVLLSCLIAFPLAWLIMKGWLDSYAYRTAIHWEIFALAGMGALAIAMLTVSLVTIRAAMANPVKSLHSE
jgi:putative ABC transport system permease protein